VGRVFFVWTSVFNLFVVSVFWAVMVDVFRSEQGKRLFGFIAVGGTLGAIGGSGLTAALAVPLGPVTLLLVSMVFLETALQCMLALTRGAPVGSARTANQEEVPIGGATLGGILGALRSPYLLGICAYMLLFTLGSTVLYFQQASLAETHFPDRAVRTAFFARLDLAVNVLTALTQIFITGRVLRLLGVAVTLTLVPLLSMIGFAALGTAPLLATFVVFQVLRRGGEYAVGRPTREILYTVVTREEKYKAKNFIDTFVYRAGDQVAAWSYTGLQAIGMGLAAISWLMVPLAALWAAVAFWLGGRQGMLARATQPVVVAHGEAGAS
jgi:AAA family ATP:ADP antiporter